MNNSYTAHPEALLEHLPFARALARSLVGGDARADDVVQESYRKALERPPRTGPDAGSLRAWFARVVRNTALEQGRSAGRRDRRERASAREEALPSAAEMSERAEAQRMLLDVLLELDEKRRQVVMLRYHEGLSSAEIARRLDVPAGTVRWQLKCGIDELRERLDERTDGDRTVWQRVLVPLAAKPLGAGAVLGGLAVFSVMAKLAVAAAALVGIALYLLDGGGPSKGPDVSAAPFEWDSAEQGLRVEESVAQSRRSLPQSGGVSSTEALPDEPSESVAALVPDPGGSSLRMRFVDPSGVGVEGVAVRPAYGLGRSTVRSDAGGVAILRFEEEHVPSWLTLVWEHPRFATDALEVGDPGQLREGSVPAPLASPRELDLGELRLRHGGTVAGVVRNEAGAPMPGLRVFVEGELISERAAGELTAVYPSRLGAVETVSDEAGRFELSGVLAGRVEVLAEDKDEVDTGSSDPFELGPGEARAGVVVNVTRVPENRRIEGVVVGPDGLPRPNTYVKARWKSLFSGGTTGSQSGSDGRFRIVFDRKSSGVELTVTADQDHGGAKREGVRTGTLDVELRLEPSRRFQVSVAAPGVDPDRSRAWVSLWDLDDNQLAAHSNLDVEGSTVDLQRPRGRFLVRAGGRGLTEVELGPFDPTQLGPGPVEVLLEAAHGWSGFVRSSAGPLVGAEVVLARAAAAYIEYAGVPSWLDPQEVDITKTSDGGAFELFPDEAGEYFVIVEAKDFARTIAGPFHFSPGADEEPLEIEVTAGGRLVGRATALDGLRTAQRLLLSAGDARPRIVTTDLDGYFEVNHLAPGPYRLRRLGREEQVSGWTSSSSKFPVRELPDPDLTVREGETTRFDLGAGGNAPSCFVVVDFRPDAAFGERFRFELVAAEGAGGPRSTESVTWVQGEPVRLELSPPGPALLRILCGDERDGLFLLRPFDALPGDQRMEIELRAGRVLIATDSHVEEPTAVGGWNESLGLWALRLAAPDRSEFVLPAGEVFTLGVESLALPPEQWTRLDEAVLAPGGEVRLERP